jgi:hypothetical protein
MNKYSEIITEFPDKEKYNLYYTAKKYEVLLKEGDILFIPQGWFHYVFSEGVNENSKLNVAINFWYDNVKKEITVNENNTENNTEDIQIKHSIINNDTFMYHSSHSLPFLSRHSIQPTFDDIKNIFSKPMLFEESKIKCFISPRIKDLYEKYMCKVFGNFQDFYENKSSYILEERDPRLRGIADAFNINTPLLSSHWWINHGNNVHSMLHCDNANNIFCQLMGSKRVILFPPSESDKLYLI